MAVLSQSLTGEHDYNGMEVTAPKTGKMARGTVEIARSLSRCVHRASLPVNSGMALSWPRAPSPFPNRFVRSRPAVWYSCLILVQTVVKEELKRSPIRGLRTTFCSGIAPRLRLLPLVLTWATLQLYACVWPGIPLNLTSRFDLEPVPSLWTCLAITRPLADHRHQAQFLTLT